jgi:hypothetical protein
VQKYKILEQKEAMKMGYTHYWRRKVDLSLGWSSFLKDVIKVYKNLPLHTDSAGGYYKDSPLKIGNWDGKGKPAFNSKEIRFNGAGKDLDHETFSFPRIRKKEKFDSKPENGMFFDFCKTAEKPYDLLVTACLLLAQKHFGNKIIVSSDGDMNGQEWQPARDLLAKLGL